MEIGHVVRGQEHGVVAGGVQSAERAINDMRFRQYHAALGLEVLDDELVLNRFELRVRVLRQCDGGEQQHGSRQAPREFMGKLFFHGTSLAVEGDASLSPYPT